MKLLYFVTAQPLYSFHVWEICPPMSLYGPHTPNHSLMMPINCKQELFALNFGKNEEKTNISIKKKKNQTGCWQHQQEQPAQSNQTAFQYLGHNSIAWFSHHALLQQLVHQPALRICDLPHFLPKNILFLKLTIITFCFTKLNPWLAYKNKLQKHHSNIE